MVEKTESIATNVMREIERSEKKMAEIMPTEKDALHLMFAAYERLKDFGFNNSCYCPKDGSVFDCIEAGSTGIHKCVYKGEWPNGKYWILDQGDMWPSRPILYRPIDNYEELE